ATAPCALAPTQSRANVTASPSSSASRCATGSSENSGSGRPWGRPRWEVTITLASRPASSFRVGAAAWIRVSSSTFPFFRGTLRSSRTSTRLAATSTSRIEAFTRARSEGRAHQGDQVDHAAAEAPLVVVPAHDLGPVLTQHRGQRRIDDRGVRVGLKIRRDQLLVGDAEDPAQLAARGLLEGG